MTRTGKLQKRDNSMPINFFKVEQVHDAIRRESRSYSISDSLDTVYEIGR